MATYFPTRCLRGVCILTRKSSECGVQQMAVVVALAPQLAPNLLSMHPHSAAGLRAEKDRLEK